jgi:ABC-type glycerol-3-phosphate transport system permease component
MIIPNVFYGVPLATAARQLFYRLPFEPGRRREMDGYKPLQIYFKVITPALCTGLFAAGYLPLSARLENSCWGNGDHGASAVATVPIAIQNFPSISTAIYLGFRRHRPGADPVVALVVIFRRCVIAA